jgi:hypothetical protein
MNKILGNAILLLAIIGSVNAGKKAVHQYGPTGIFGSHKKTAITVGSVDKGSPADGKIKSGMKIIGVGSSKFKKDVRRELAAAIDIAESKKGAGKLTLMVKGGKSVNLQLRVLGSYSDTSPYNCQKTEAILKQAALVQFKVTPSKKKRSKNVNPELGRMYLELLGKMALGGKEAVKEYATYEWESTSENHSYCTWMWGYRLIAMGEYYLLTGDKKVLPHMKNYAVGLAKGQDAGGIWGHQLATEKRNWRLPGYAQMNQPSLTCFMGMVMAKKCGIQDPDLNKGIQKAYKYFSSYIGKGTFGYGVHGPNTGEYNNNGMSASAALSMYFIGDKKGASFFSKLSAASHGTLERGHASAFFNPLWTALGTSLSGPEATAAFFKESRWLYTMYRSWDGKITWDGKHKEKTGNVGDGILLSYCLSRRNLYITGKSPDKSLWLNSSDAKKTVALSKIDYKNSSADELLAMIGHPIPQVRRGAVWNLRAKKGDLISHLKKLMKEGTIIQKKGAIAYFGYGCPKQVALDHMNDLGAILRNSQEDPEVRATAAYALCFIGAPARKYYGEMLKLLVVKRDNDFVGSVDEKLGKSISILSKTPFKDGLVTDKDLFYKAALKLVDHKRQGARATGLNMLAEIPLKDFHLIADKVMHVIKDKDPTYHSYHNPGGPLGGAITILANLNIKEGMQYALDIHNLTSGKASFKMQACWSALAKYGPNAKPALKELVKMYTTEKGLRTNFGRHTGKYKAMVKAIETGKPSAKLISFDDAVKFGKK